MCPSSKAVKFTTATIDEGEEVVPRILVLLSVLRGGAPSFLFTATSGLYLSETYVFSPLARPRRPPLHLLCQNPHRSVQLKSRNMPLTLRLAKLIPAIRALRAFVMLLIFYVQSMPHRRFRASFASSILN